MKLDPEYLKANALRYSGSSRYSGSKAANQKPFFKANDQNSQLLSRTQRLNVREFAVAFEKGRVLRHPLLHLRFYQRQGDRCPAKLQLRAAFVAPKKLGNAVVRNSIRRRFRERYRLLQYAKTTIELKNCDLLFMATAECRTASMAQIDEALTQLLKRAAKHVATE